METIFREFPKLSRLSRDIIITEKLDGTNAQIFIADMADIEVDFSSGPEPLATQTCDGGRVYGLWAGSRTRNITPESDNFGFAGWAKRNAESLFGLGPGRHFGEWWGKGIQRSYNLPDRRFSLFNVSRWSDDPVVRDPKHTSARPDVCSVVPVVYVGPFDTTTVDYWVEQLRAEGSIAAPGYMKPEGVVVFHTASNTAFKKTLDSDHLPKGMI